MQYSIFRSVLLIIGVVSCVQAALGEKNTFARLRPCSIASVINTTNKKYQIYGNNRQIVLPPINKPAQLRNVLTIPFVSIKNYLIEYVKDRPFVPEQALKISSSFVQNSFLTNLGRTNEAQAHRARLRTMYIWQNESGIVCAPDPKIYPYASKWKAHCIFDPSTANTAKSILLFQLVLTSNGTIGLRLL